MKALALPLFVFLTCWLSYAFNPPVSYPTTYRIGTTSIYAGDTINSPFAFSRYAQTTVSPGHKRGTRYYFDGISYVTGQTCNFRLALYDRNGGYIVPGDNLELDTAQTRITIYTPSIGHDSTYALSFAQSNIQSAQIQGDTTRIRFYTCLAPFQGLSFNSFVMFRQ